MTWVAAWRVRYGAEFVWSYLQSPAAAALLRCKLAAPSDAASPNHRRLQWNYFWILIVLIVLDRGRLLGSQGPKALTKTDRLKPTKRTRHANARQSSLSAATNVRLCDNALTAEIKPEPTPAWPAHSPAHSTCASIRYKPVLSSRKKGHGILVLKPVQRFQSFSCHEGFGLCPLPMCALRTLGRLVR